MADSNQNLLNNKKDEAETDKSISKIIFLGIAQILLALFCSYFLKLFILGGQFNYLLFSFLALLGFLAFFLLNVFFIKSLWRVNLIIFLATLALAAPFYDQLSETFGIGILATFLIFLWSNYSGRWELENMLNIKFWRVSKKTLPKTIVAAAVFIGIAFISTANFEAKGFFIPESVFEQIVFPLSGISFVQKYVPGLDLSLPTETLLKNIATKQVENNAQLKSLPSAAKDQLINQGVSDLENQISNFIGSPIDSKAKAIDALYNALANRFSVASPTAKSVAPFIVAALIFLIIVGLSWPIRLLATFLAFLIYEICLAMGFGVIMMEGRSREIILLK